MGDFVSGLLARDSPIPVSDVLTRSSASPDAGTTSTIGTKELQNKSLTGPCIRGAEKLKIDVIHRYAQTGYQRTENKVTRRSAITKLKVLLKRLQIAINKVAQGNHLFTVKSRFLPRFPLFREGIRSVILNFGILSSDS